MYLFVEGKIVCCAGSLSEVNPIIAMMFFLSYCENYQVDILILDKSLFYYTNLIFSRPGCLSALHNKLIEESGAWFEKKF